MCVAWARGADFKLDVPPEEPEYEEDEREYISPDHTSKGLEFTAISEIAKILWSSEAAIPQYCDWSKENGPALVEEFMKRAKV